MVEKHLGLTRPIYSHVFTPILIELSWELEIAPHIVQNIDFWNSNYVRYRNTSFGIP